MCVFEEPKKSTYRTFRPIEKRNTLLLMPFACWFFFFLRLVFFLPSPFAVLTKHGAKDSQMVCCRSGANETNNGMMAKRPLCERPFECFPLFTNALLYQTIKMCFEHSNPVIVDTVKMLNVRMRSPHNHFGHFPSFAWPRTDRLAWFDSDIYMCYVCVRVQF